jgi:hypothetical protein
VPLSDNFLTSIACENLYIKNCDFYFNINLSDDIKFNRSDENPSIFRLDRSKLIIIDSDILNLNYTLYEYDYFNINRTNK